MKYDSAATVFDSPVGRLYARADAGMLTELSYVHGPSRERRRHAEHEASRLVIDAVELQIGEYFAGRRSAFDIPMALTGPCFHVRVWEALCAIPYGTTTSYGQLATDLGDAGASRAVGAANAANPIVIIVPCHRVIGADGRLVGYGGGLLRKRTLLDLECGRTALDLTPNAVLNGTLHTQQAAT